MKEEMLKPCTFCGDATTDPPYENDQGEFEIVCDKCMAKMGGLCPVKEGVIENWNRRTDAVLGSHLSACIQRSKDLYGELITIKAQLKALRDNGLEFLTVLDNQFWSSWQSTTFFSDMEKFRTFLASTEENKNG